MLADEKLEEATGGIMRGISITCPARGIPFGSETTLKARYKEYPTHDPENMKLK